ncbi:multidrug effflux MFS transporter [Pararhodobacter oceanensis]|uniref:Bcr/CflA family efflux transporter n=1 Tax=Pararhodobacter oceanensis TaxID=2172121 RepID=A0A2T8HTP4_9RHOB|nr:multidrug effflux MFS transporter [Pararhodobacter oceanensis]PVH28788.1 multidrug MFS transporter [Pararhodobacter oceanensis]
MKPIQKMPFVEFVIFTALMFATVAYSIDSMLPLLSDMGAELAPDAAHRAQFVITSFVFGLGLGTLMIGPISDALGRKSVILAGIAVYMVASIIAATSENMGVLLFARFLQGLGVAAPRVVTQAMVRDQYAGRLMARVMSFAMTLFVLVPAVAPLLGATLGHLFGWRAIFWSFLGFGSICGIWLWLRQPETLPRENRVSLEPGPVLRAFREVFRNRQVMAYLTALTFSFASVFVWLSSVAQIYDDVYDRLPEFPFWFALSALLSAPGSFINAQLVMRLGMRRLIVIALIGQCTVVATVLVGYALIGSLPFWLFFTFMFLHFFSIGLLFGNLNALALEPLGHIAGTASSVMGGISTMASAAIAAPIAALYNQTALPMTAGVGVCAFLAFSAMMVARRWDAPVNA